MPQQCDVVIIGAGHNGLTTAAYLTKAGLNVRILEKNSYIGGGCVTQELSAPGFKNDPCATAHMFNQWNPIITNDELGLKSKYGLKYHYAEVNYASIFPDGRAFINYRDLDKTCSFIEKHYSAKQADSYRKFIGFCDSGMKLLSQGSYVPPPSVGALSATLDQSYEGREILRVFSMSALDFLNEWFDDDYIKMAMGRFFTEAMAGPREGGTALYAYIINAMNHSTGMGFPEGGSGVYADKLAQFVRDNGGTVETDRGIKQILTSGGRATGVVLEDGETILAKRAVISAVHVKQLFLHMLPPEALPDGFIKSVKRVRNNTLQAMNQLLAMNEAPKYRVGSEFDDVNRAGFVEVINSTDMVEFCRFFEDMANGIPRYESPLMICQTLFDPTRAPAGKHTGYLYHYEPYHLKDGFARWDSIGKGIADQILEYYRKYTTNMGDENILGRAILNPLDFSRKNTAFYEGEIMGVGNNLYQSFSYRPIPGWGNYKTPIDGLYMTGASCHPGGAISSGPGRAAAMVICEDMKIDFDKLIR